MVRLRAKVMAGWAKLVEEVSQVAAVMVSATLAGTAAGRCRTVPKIVTR